LIVWNNTDGHHSYRELATFSLACGESSKAVKYAKMELEVERYCVGAETAHLEKNTKGAEFWLPHVESEHVKLQEKQRAKEMHQVSHNSVSSFIASTSD
jgi:hypothetical protein